MRGPAALATYIAGGLILGGFAIIYGAWNGTAGIDRLSAQFPYLVSGGMVGVGFIIAGCALWVVQTSRQLGAYRALDMKRLDQSLAGVVAVLGGPALGGETATADLVVAGRSSFHDPACHLVADRADLRSVPRSVAAAEGLSPCRVCKPA